MSLYYRCQLSCDDCRLPGGEHWKCYFQKYELVYNRITLASRIAYIKATRPTICNKNAYDILDSLVDNVNTER